MSTIHRFSFPFCNDKFKGAIASNTSRNMRIVARNTSDVIAANKPRASGSRRSFKQIDSAPNCCVYPSYNALQALPCAVHLVTLG